MPDQRVSPGGTGWRAMVDGGVRAEAASMVLRMAERLADPHSVRTGVDRAMAGAAGTHYWHPTSFETGYAGLAVFYGYLAAIFPGQGWDHAAWDFISQATRATREQPIGHPGLCNGSSGLAFALRCLAELDKRYLPAAVNGFEVAAGQVVPREGWAAGDSGLADERAFDVISGDAGVLTALLSHPSPSARVDHAIRVLVANLVMLCQPTARPGLRTWRVRPRRPRPDGELRGWYDVGLAHGVLGAATALAMAYGLGYRHDRLVAAIDNVYSWFAGHAVHDDRGINWPDSIPAETDDDPAARQRAGVARPGWCYGSAGAAAALRLGGIALRRPAFQQLALAAIESAARWPAGRRQLGSPILCHGLAGLLLVCLRFAQDSPSTVLRDAIPRLAGDLIGMCDPSQPFFVSDPRPTGERVAEPGLLTGTAGVGLALLAAISPVEPRWDRAMLLSV